MEGVLELHRVLHEERERLMEVISQEMVKKKSTHREQLNSDHRIKLMLNRYTEISSKLSDLYEDKDGMRRQDISALSNSPFNEFYNRLRILREFYRKHPDEVSVPLSVQVAVYTKMGEGDNEEDLLATFTDEEGQGRYLDLHNLYEKYVNLKGIKKVDYYTFLKTFDQLFDIPKETKGTSAYKNYAEGLHDYLVDFLKRSKPLIDLKLEMQNAVIDFDSKWPKGQFPGWPKGLHSAQAAYGGIDLRTISSVDELMHLGLERLKNELTRLGMKCGGTLQERANRLWSVKGKLPSQIDPSLRNPVKIKEDDEMRQKELATTEAKIYRFSELLSEQRHDTLENVQRKQARTGQEREEEDDEAADEEEEDEDEDEVLYNPKNLPLGWDGKPIPYWLYKLHGLNINYPCEICGNQIYRGPKAFQRHFSEWRHAHGMRCLGIPNTAHFANITQIEEAIKLWEKLKKVKNVDKWKPDVEEEFEDTAGNVVSRKTYEDLRRQGLL